MDYIVANWKSNKTLTEAEQWFDEFAKLYSPQADKTVIIGAPFPYLFQIAEKAKSMDLLHISSEDISSFPFGAYTGATTINMVKDAIDYAIVGHSERREYFHESHQDIANKVSLLHEAGVTPILCVDAPYAGEQISALEQSDLQKLIVAYEPLEAIGSGTPQEPEEVGRVAAEIAQQLPQGTPILYGGSVNENNYTTYLNVDSISGLLVGGASLDPERFAGVCGLK